MKCICDNSFDNCTSTWSCPACIAFQTASGSCAFGDRSVETAPVGVFRDMARTANTNVATVPMRK